MAWQLLEKAVAKLAGSYTRLKSGSSLRAWIALTGCLDVEYYVRDGVAWQPKQVDVSPSGTSLEDWDKKTINGGVLPARLSGDAMIRFLSQHAANNHLMSAAIGDMSADGRRHVGACR